MNNNTSKKIILIRAKSINPDPRTEKEALFLTDKYKFVNILGWDRDNVEENVNLRNNYIIYHCHIRSSYGLGMKNLPKLLAWFFYEFFWLFKREVDVIHALGFDAYLLALIIAKLRNKKIIYDIPDFYTDMISNTPAFIKNFIKKIDLFLIQFADGVILANDFQKNQIKGSKPKRLIVIYNTPNDFYERFKKNIETSKSNKDFTLVYIGLIQKERGFDTLVEVLRELPDVKLIIGGYGPYKKNFLEKINGMKNIEFLGKVYPYEKTIEIESKASALFALYDPSVPNHRYSSPNKMFEAMMLSKPIIVSQNTGMDKIVEKYKCGIIVDYDNHNQLKEAILKLREMKKKGDNFYGDNGRKAYLNVFHPTVMKNRLLKLYEAILH